MSKLPLDFCARPRRTRGNVLSDIGNMLTFSDPNWQLVDSRTIAEIYFSNSAQKSDSGFVIKEILRTGEWPVIPTRGGVMNKPLKIVRNGVSDREKGVISLEELKKNFDAGAIPNVQIPLSDVENNDHKNTTRLNTGFVREVWIEDEGDISKLVAKMEFTEPDVKEKALRGTYADVSCGIPWSVMSRGRKYGACLEHVCITNRPFIDGLGPFIALSDKRDGAEVLHFATESLANRYLTQEQQESLGGTHPAGEISHSNAMDAVINSKKIIETANKMIAKIFGEHFVVEAIRPDGFHVVNDEAKSSWVIPFSLHEGQIKTASIDDWIRLENDKEKDSEDNNSNSNDKENGTQQSVNKTTPEEANENESLSPLEKAQQFRQERVGLSDHTTTQEAPMPLTYKDLDRVDLSAIPEDQRNLFKKLIDEHVALSAKAREAEVDKRIAELEDLGLKDRPGALKLYRQIALSDDQGPAVVLLSDNGTQKEETLTACEILDRFIDACKGPDGKVTLSDQAIVSGNDHKPPADAGEEKPLAERVREAREALGYTN